MRFIRAGFAYAFALRHRIKQTVCWTATSVTTKRVAANAQTLPIALVGVSAIRFTFAVFHVSILLYVLLWSNGTKVLSGHRPFVL